MPTAQEDLKKKLRLEKELKPEIKRYHERVRNDFATMYASTGNTLDMLSFDDELTQILRGHYNNVADEFYNRISVDLPDDIAITEDEEDIIFGALTTYYLAQSSEQAKLINQTTQTNIEESLVSAAEDETVRERTGIESQLVTAAVAGAFLSRKLEGRVTGILVSETQLAAEAAKATEAEVLAGLTPSVVASDNREIDVFKEWVTVGDSRVRPAHVSADGQKVQLNKPFTVDNQQLRWPRDTALGASARNVVNCRCSSVVDEKQIVKTRRNRL